MSSSAPPPPPADPFSDPLVLAARKECLDLALRPVPKDRYAWDQWNMACVHTVLFNRLEATYRNAGCVPEGDLGNYVLAARADVGWVLEHHVSEEEFYFPFFPASTGISSNLSAHASFSPLVHSALAYLSSVSPTPKAKNAAFSPAHFRALLAALLPPLAAHLSSELATLSPALLRAHMSVDALEKANTSVQAHRAREEDAWVHGAAIMDARPDGMRGVWPSDGGWALENVMIPVWRWWAGARGRYVWGKRWWENGEGRE